MRIIFFGSGAFGIPSLEYLLEERSESLLAVVTQPDRKAGRGMKLKPTDVKIYLEKIGYKGLLFQPSDVNADSFLVEIQELKPDIFVVCSFGQIFKKPLLDLPTLFAVNIHASLLPKYRGAAPVNWAIINGEKETGLTIFKMSEKMDAGEILLQRAIPIEEDDTAMTLEGKLANLAPLLLKEALDLIQRGEYTLSPQGGVVSYAPKLKKEDGLIDWGLPAVSIYNRIRGLQPWPSAYTYLDGKLLKIFKAEVTKRDIGTPSEIIEVGKDFITVRCGKDALRLYEVQLEGKRRMDVRDFLLGHRIQVGKKLG